MKYILILVVLISMGAEAQKRRTAPRPTAPRRTLTAADSALMNVTVTMQFRDWSFLIGENLIDAATIEGENLYDKVKTTVRGNAAITGTTTVVSDTMNASYVEAISAGMRDRRFSPMYSHFTRINTALRAATGEGAGHLLRRLNDLDDADGAEDTRRMQRGINRLKGVSN
jgi:hypothetical protein